VFVRASAHLKKQKSDLHVINEMRLRPSVQLNVFRYLSNCWNVKCSIDYGDGVQVILTSQRNGVLPEYWVHGSMMQRNEDLFMYSWLLRLHCSPGSPCLFDNLTLLRSKGSSVRNARKTDNVVQIEGSKFRILSFNCESVPIRIPQSSKYS
jgi:hypothetical protein